MQICGPGYRIGCLIALVSLASSLTSVLAGTTYYVATNGLAANDGLTTNSAWPLTYALAHARPSNSIIVMPGTWFGAEIDIGQSYLTVQSQFKWAARILRSPGTGAAIWSSSHTVHDVVLDGFEISYASQHGAQIFSSNCVIRNCWIHHCGTNAGTVASGIVNHYLTFWR